MTASPADRSDLAVSALRPLRLRPLRVDDEEAFRAGHRAMAVEHWPFGLDGFDQDPPWPDWLRRLESARRGDDLVEGWVPATFLVADVGGVIVGRASIRHRLTDWLAREGGHIGYGVLPGHRRLGYATEILRQSLVVARAAGVDRALVICHDDNVGSATVIERCGGVLEAVRPSEDGSTIRHYWID